MWAAMATSEPTVSTPVPPMPVIRIFHARLQVMPPGDHGIHILGRAAVNLAAVENLAGDAIKKPVD